jgi:hypothetical protein
LAYLGGWRFFGNGFAGGVLGGVIMACGGIIFQKIIN